MNKILLFVTILGINAAFGGIIEWQMACKAGNAQACTAAAEYFYGMARTEDHYKKAAQMYKIACDKDVSEACSGLGILYAEGQGVKMDTKKARELFKKACDNGEKSGCYNYEESFKE